MGEDAVEWSKVTLGNRHDGSNSVYARTWKEHTHCGLLVLLSRKMSPVAPVKILPSGLCYGQGRGEVGRTLDVESLSRTVGLVKDCDSNEMNKRESSRDSGWGGGSRRSWGSNHGLDAGETPS